jgi:hypothetical protein
MTTRTTTAERRFNDSVDRLRNRGIDIQLKTTPADDLFGETVQAAAYRNGAFVSYTLRRAGGIKKRTSLTTFAGVNGERCCLSTALGRILNSY